MEPRRSAPDDKQSPDLNGEDSGTALRPHGLKLSPRVATVTRAEISLDECIETPINLKSRTQFLASNYIGEVAVLPGAWSSGDFEENSIGSLMFLADPKPVGQEPLQSGSPGKGDKAGTDILNGDDKFYATSKRADIEDGDGDKKQFSLRNRTQNDQK